MAHVQKSIHEKEEQLFQLMQETYRRRFSGPVNEDMVQEIQVRVRVRSYSKVLALKFVLDW